MQSRIQSQIMPPVLLRALAENWWMFLIRGLASISFGVLALMWPKLTLFTLVLFYGSFMLVDGVIAIIAAIKGSNPNARWWLLIAGICSVIAGVLTFLMPGLTALLLLFIIAGASIAGGIFQIIGAIALRKEMKGELLLILGGLASVAFGILLFAQPGTGALAVVWLIAVYAIVLGIIFLGLAFELRGQKSAAA